MGIHRGGVWAGGSRSGSPGSSPLRAKPPARWVHSSEFLIWQPSSAAQACWGPHPPPSNTAAPRSDPSCPSLAWLVSPTAVSYCTGVVTASAALELRRVGVLVPTCNAPRYKSVPLAGDAGPETFPFWDVFGGRRLCLPQSWRNPTCRRVSNASQQDVLGRKHVEQKWARFPIIYTHL